MGSRAELRRRPWSAPGARTRQNRAGKNEQLQLKQVVDKDGSTDYLAGRTGRDPARHNGVRSALMKFCLLRKPPGGILHPLDRLRLVEFTGCGVGDAMLQVGKDVVEAALEHILATSFIESEPGCGPLTPVPTLKVLSEAGGAFIGRHFLCNPMAVSFSAQARAVLQFAASVGTNSPAGHIGVHRLWGCAASRNGCRPIVRRLWPRRFILLPPHAIHHFAQIPLPHGNVEDDLPVCMPLPCARAKIHILRVPHRPAVTASRIRFQLGLRQSASRNQSRLSCLRSSATYNAPPLGQIVHDRHVFVPLPGRTLIAFPGRGIGSACRRLMPALNGAFHDGVDLVPTFSPNCSATAFWLAVFSQEIARASASAVKRLDGSAQGSFTTRTPWVGHWLRGGSARKMVWYWQAVQVAPPLGARADDRMACWLLQYLTGYRLPTGYRSVDKMTCTSRGSNCKSTGRPHTGRATDAQDPPVKIAIFHTDLDGDA